MSPDVAENRPPPPALLIVLIFPSLNELYALILHTPDLGLGQEEASVEREGHDVGGDLAAVLLGLEGHDDLVIGVGDELEGGKAVRGDHLPHVPDGDVAEVLGGTQQQVGAPALVVLLAVALVAGAARQEEPALQCVAPAGRLVDEVAWGHTDRSPPALPRARAASPLHADPRAARCRSSVSVIFSLGFHVLLFPSVQSD